MDFNNTLKMVEDEVNRKVRMIIKEKENAEKGRLLKGLGKIIRDTKQCDLNSLDIRLALEALVKKPK